MSRFVAGIKKYQLEGLKLQQIKSGKPVTPSAAVAKTEKEKTKRSLTEVRGKINAIRNR